MAKICHGIKISEFSEQLPYTLDIFGKMVYNIIYGMKYYLYMGAYRISTGILKSNKRVVQHNLLKDANFKFKR